MADVKVRGLREDVVEFHRAQAQAAGRSLEEELRRLLTDTALAQRAEAIRELNEGREKLRKRYGVFPDSTEIIRAERDERG
ncbi:MAG: hypothetical protein AB7O45_01095 [Alphaproteobacteria bacterium]